jgi:hypothetical protein
MIANGLYTMTLDTGAGREIVRTFRVLHGDVNGDGEVDKLDLKLLDAGRGTPDLAADLDGDGTVGESDFRIVDEILNANKE